MLNNIKLTLEYDGTNYYGWQKQKELKTIQGEIEEAIELVTKEYCEVTGSSRTDAGVHAKGFVANFKTNSKVPPAKFREALNVKLPEDIVIIKSEQVEDDFHARYCAKGKTYEYYILNSEVPSALMRNQMYHYKYDLDIDAMKIAAKQFIGTHDFAAFKTQGSSVKGTVRTIFDVKVEKEEIVLAIDSMKQVDSIYEEDSENNKLALIDRVSSEKDETDTMINRIFIKELLNKMDSRDRQIIMLRYFNGKTQSQVAKMLNISQVQVSRIEKKILKLMVKK